MEKRSNGGNIEVKSASNPKPNPNPSSNLDPHPNSPPHHNPDLTP